MKKWYTEYWAQTWYKNTFLVRRPDQIAQAIGHDREWNNVYDSGCNFTCLAMIVGIDPARLASELSSHGYFFADAQLPAKHLTGKTAGLVWDQNAPHIRLNSIVLKDIWHSHLNKRVSIAVRFLKKTSITSYLEGKRWVAAVHTKGQHVICGPEDHSHLVAGTIGEAFFLWDPDDSCRSVEENLEGKITLRRLFDECPSQPIEFWGYQLHLSTRGTPVA